MNKIIIEDLEVFAFHGVYAEEKKLGQLFLVSAEISVSFEKLEDSILEAVSYSQVCREIEALMQANNFDLIESCAEFLAEKILLTHESIEKIKITVKKPWAPMKKHLKFVAVQIEKCWYDAFIGVGSNLGSREENIEKALELLGTSSTKLVKTSNHYETKPISDTPQSDYLNLAVHVKTLLSPAALMNHLHKIETQLEREREERWVARTIDLDLLFFGNKILNTPDLTLPHPKLHERLFVLAPLADLIPNFLHPNFHKTIFDLKEEIRKNSTKITKKLPRATR